MTAIIVVFVLAYTAIAFEHPLRINKAATALIACGVMWTLYALAAQGGSLPSAPHGLESVAEQLTEKLGETAAIVFFLIGAMTIVEVTDSHGGFEVITKRIRAKKLSSLLWVIGFIAFFLSSILDNMTTTILMVTLMKRLLRDHEQRLLFAGIIVIAANAGGAWTPIGDVTTTMLWIGGQITTGEIIKGLFLPSMACLLAPLAVASFMLKGNVVAPDAAGAGEDPQTSDFEKTLMFCMGMGVFVVRAGIQVGHAPAALPGHPVGARHPVAGVGNIALEQARGGEGSPDAGQGTQAHRHVLGGVLHRDPARGSVDECQRSAAGTRHVAE